MGWWWGEGERLVVALGQVKEEDFNQDTEIKNGEDRGLKQIHKVILIAFNILNKKYTNHANHSVSMPTSCTKITVQFTSRGERWSYFTSQ